MSQSLEAVFTDGLGAQAEQFACEFLLRQGYDIVERNFKIPQGELDIIATHRGVLVFIEVKCLSRPELYYHPEEQISKKKLRSLTMASLAYLEKHPKYALTRFDVLALSPSDTELELFKVKHFEDAFGIDG